MPPPDFVTSIFADKLTVDDRDPSFTFSLPFFEGEYGLLTPSLSFWTQLIVLLVFQTVICIGLALIILHLIVKKRGSVASYLVGYGVIIPAVLSFPYAIIKYLDIQNVMVRFVLYMPTLISFRCLEAMHCSQDKAPIAESSTSNYILYYSCLVEVKYDSKTEKPLKLTEIELARRLWRIVSQYFMLAGLYSLVMKHSFAPFDCPKEAHSLDHTIPDMLRLGHLGNNLIGAYLMYLTLSFSQSAVAFAINLFGFATVDVMRNPLLASTSPSDFWSRRWNQVIHSMLKRGVFKPVAQSFSRTLAVVAAFIASGLLHEYVWSFIFFQHDDVETFTPGYGKSMLFFAWNGIVMVLENLISHWPIFQMMKSTLPTPVITHLVLLLALPVGHLFTGDLIEGGYFSDFAVALPLIVRLD
mmetsp:Transcript_13466/g.27484  ORF Transcript_13466/g.27484 Transcript_13466/m.27484 type:complete len:412 (+) Transcript_13466:135-1370(+)